MTATFDEKRRIQMHRQKVAALSDFWTFLDLISFKGGTSSFGAIHKELAAWISDNEKRPRRLVLMPRGHLKSTLCSVGYVLWRIYQNPNIRILVGTATKPLATSFVREIKQYLEDPDLQATVWNDHPRFGRLIPKLEGGGGGVPRKSFRKRNVGDDENFEEEYTEAEDKKVIWKADAVQVLRTRIMKEPTVVASSVGSPMTGFHYDLAIFDDIVTFDNSDTPEKADRIIEWVGDIESVVDPYNPQTGLGGEFIILGTRYYYRDLYGIYTGEDLTDEEREEQREEALLYGDGDDEHLYEYDVFKRNIYANGVNDADGYLWGERFTPRVVEQIKRRLMKLPNGLRRFASQYLNSVMTDEEAVLNPNAIQWINSSALRRTDTGVVEINVSNSVTPVRIKPVLVVDPAISQRKQADNTVIAVGGVDADQNLYLLDIKVGHFTPNETVDRMYDLLDKWHLNTATIDNEKLGQALMHTIRSSFQRKRVIALREYKAEGDKKTRITTCLEPLFTNGKIFMMSWMSTLSVLMEEISFFPRAGAHDDCLDAMEMVFRVAVPTRRPSNNVRRKRIGRHYSFNRRYGGVR
ncbi:hypothetical protein [Cyanophage BHS3]|nr:hypothetical protein [Cyanophage BHS3]